MAKGNVEDLVDAVEDCRAYLGKVVEHTDGSAKDWTIKEIIEKLDDQSSSILDIRHTIGERDDPPWDGKRVEASLVSLLKRLCLVSV